MKHLRRRAAERVVAGWCLINGYPEVHIASPSNVRFASAGGKTVTRSYSHDLFRAFDVEACNRVATIRVQVTTPDGVSKRKRKIEGRQWPVGDLAYVAIVADHGGGKNGTIFWHEYNSQGTWVLTDTPVRLDKCLAAERRMREQNRQKKTTASERAAAREATRRLNP